MLFINYNVLSAFYVSGIVQSALHNIILFNHYNRSTKQRLLLALFTDKESEMTLTCSRSRR